MEYVGQLLADPPGVFAAGAGRSIGSLPDGAWTRRVQFQLPTPGAPNSNETLPLSINEWMARNTATITDPADGDLDDWFEIYNAGPQPLDLSGYLLTDDLEDPAQSEPTLLQNARCRKSAARRRLLLHQRSDCSSCPNHIGSV